MNRTKALDNARNLTFVSFLLFVLAAISALIPYWGLYASLGLVLFGGFSMIMGRMLADRASPKPQGRKEQEEEDEEGAEKEKEEENLA